MYENEDVIQLTEADAKLPTTEAEAQDRHNRIVRHAQQLHAEVEAGKKTLAEKDRRIEQMAVDLKALQQSLSIIGSRDPMESAGASDVELRRFVDNDGKLFLRGYESNDPAQRRSDDTGLLTTQPVNDAHRNLIEATEALYVTAVVKHGRDAFNHTGTAYREGVVKGLGTAYHRVQRAWSAMPKFVKRAWDDQNGSGGEFIPTPLLASPMWQVGEYDPEGLLSLFPRTQISTESVEMPVGTLYPVPYKGGGATGDNPAALAKSTVGTDKITLTANPMYVMVFVHEDAAADSIVAAFPFIRSSIARSLAIGSRFTVVNGDTASSHQDDLANWDLRGMFGAIDAGSIDYRRTFLGLRANALDSSNGVDRSTHSLSTLVSDINLVGGPRGVPTDMPIVTSWEGYLKNFVNLSGIVKANEYGDRAPIVRGEVASIFGHPIIPTDAMSADLNASGVYDNSVTDYTGYVIFNRTMHTLVERAGATVALQNDITVAGTYLRARQRLGFKDMTKSSDASVRYAYKMGK